jgi:glyoxylase-like metal-dependent hydrolase (beta-lactamase superfamily II)
MTVAAVSHRLVTPTLLEWSAYSAEVKCVLTAHAWSHDGKVVLVDPIPADAPATGALQQLGRPVLIIATNANHDRAIPHWKTLLNIPVAASAHAAKDLGIKPDVILESCPVIHGLHPIALEGGPAGEHALHSPEQKLLIVGDALVHLPETGLAPLPDKYCADPAKLRASLAKLAALPFDTLAFAHGQALASGARTRLRQALGLS